MNELASADWALLACMVWFPFGYIVSKIFGENLITKWIDMFAITITAEISAFIYHEMICFCIFALLGYIRISDIERFEAEREELNRANG